MTHQPPPSATTASRPRRLPVLTVAAEGGLCNRMRVVSSAAALAATGTCRVRVAWSNKPECACRFDDIFLPVFSEDREIFSADAEADATAAGFGMADTDSAGCGAEADANAPQMLSADADAGATDLHVPTDKSHIFVADYDAATQDSHTCASASHSGTRVPDSAGCGADVDAPYARALYNNVYPAGDAALAAANFSIVDARAWHAPVSRRNLWLPALLRLPLYGAQRKNFNASGTDDILAVIARHRRTYISTCYEFFRSPFAARQLFRPVAAVRTAVDGLAAHFTADTIGMHIRTGDHKLARRHSPTQLFLDTARREIALRPQTTIFLATDSAEVREAFNSAFPSRVITQGAELTRNTAAGMTAAAVDLFALARTKTVYGSFASSFSDTAAELGGIPLITLDAAQPQH